MASFAEFLRRLARRDAPPEPARTHEPLDRFTERAATTLLTLRPDWQPEVSEPGLLRSRSAEDETLDLRNAYAFYLSTVAPVEEVLSMSIAVLLTAPEVPTRAEFLVPCLRPARWLRAVESVGGGALPSTRFSSHLAIVAAFACGGALRYAKAADLSSLGLATEEAIARAHRNALDGASVGLELVATGETKVWSLRTDRGSPTAVVSGGSDALRTVTERAGITAPVCALSSDREVLVADLAHTGSIGALVQIARPLGGAVPPNSLACLLLTRGAEGEWVEFGSPSPELFASLAPELRELYPDATVCAPALKHDGRGTSFWVIEWELRPGRFVFPTAADVVLVTPADGPKRWPTLPRELRSLVSELGSKPGHTHASSHQIVQITDARRCYRALEKLPLVRLQRSGQGHER